MSFGLKCIKFTVFFFNFFFFLAGVGVMSTGIYAQLKLQNFSDLTSVKYLTGATLVIAAGASITLVAFFGCCGAVRENRCFLCVYFVLLALILAAEIAGAVLAYTSRNQIKSKLHQDLNSTLTVYESDVTMRTAFDLLQKKELCCGVDSYRDWRATPFAKTENTTSDKKVPDSCCKKISEGCGKNFKTADINEEGCYDKLTELFRSKLKLIAIVAIFVAVFQIIGLIFAFTLLIKVGKSEYRRAPLD